jgi:hypothetical protein
LQTKVPEKAGIQAHDANDHSAFQRIPLNLKHIFLDKAIQPHACRVCTIVLQDPELPFL